MSTRDPMLICLNGDLAATLPQLDRSAYTCVLAADGAVTPLLEAGWVPNVVLGDFDSAGVVALGRAKRAGAEIVPAPSQDATDFEKALDYAADQGVREIDVIGHAGRRLDHALGNISAASRRAREFRLRLLDPVGIGTLRRKGETESIDDADGRTCSVIAISASRVTLRGFRWEMTDGLLGGETHQSISNVITAPHAEVEVHQGTVLVYLHRG